MSSTAQSNSPILRFLMLAMLIVTILALTVEAGGKGKGGMEDIIMYNGNIVLRGDKKGGSIVLANNHANEEVEYVPNYFGQYGEMGGR